MYMFYQNKRFILKNVKAGNGLKMETEAPDLTTHRIKRYSKLTKPTRLKRIGKVAIFQKSLGLSKSTTLTHS